MTGQTTLPTVGPAVEGSAREDLGEYTFKARGYLNHVNPTVLGLLIMISLYMSLTSALTYRGDFPEASAGGAGGTGALGLGSVPAFCSALAGSLGGTRTSTRKVRRGRWSAVCSHAKHTSYLEGCRCWS